MINSKVIILAEVSILPQFLNEVKELAARTLIPTLKEEGCEVFYQTSKTQDPNALVFFEVFVSQAALDLHMDAGYTKTFFAGIKGKLSGEPITTILSEWN
jgi:quinol monooxygenase YgiN